MKIAIRIVLIMALAMLLVGCDWFTKKDSVEPECINCAVPADVHLDLPLPPPLDLSRYESVTVYSDGKVTTMSVEDYTRFYELLSVLEGRIGLLESIIFAHREYYEKQTDE